MFLHFHVLFKTFLLRHLRNNSIVLRIKTSATSEGVVFCLLRFLHAPRDISRLTFL